MSFAAFLVGVLATRGIVSVGSLLGALALPVAVLGIRARSGEPLGAQVALTAALSILIWLKHLPNLRRIARGEEKRIFGSRDRGGVGAGAARMPGSAP